MRIPTQVRQGDVLLERVDITTDGATPRPRDAGRVILAYGEVTGHAHQIEAPDACGAALLDAPTGETWLTLGTPSRLVHEEHDPIALDAGTYRVLRQREYTDTAPVYVAD